MFLIKLLLIGTILVFGFSGVSFGQTLPICNEKSGLEWDMNTEADMKEYVLYHSPTVGVTKTKADVVQLIIPHDPSQAVDNGDGTFSVIHKLVMPEGDRFMALTARDAAQNETDLSNEVGCLVNGTPKTPSIILRFNLS